MGVPDDIGGSEEETSRLLFVQGEDTGFTQIRPMVRRPEQRAILDRAEDPENLSPKVRAASQASRLAVLATIIGDLANPGKTNDPDFLLRKIRAAVNLTLPSERDGLRGVLVGVKNNLPAESTLQILHDKETAQRDDWKVVVRFDGGMFSV